MKIPSLFFILVSVMGCTDLEESRLYADDLPGTAQLLDVATPDGTLYQLPIEIVGTSSRAALASVASTMELTAYDTSGQEIPLTPIIDSQDEREEPVFDEIRIWPLREASDADAIHPKIWVNSIGGFKSCWFDQTIPFVGGELWYTIYDAFSVDGFIDSSNDFVDFDLYLYDVFSELCASTGLAGFVDTCGSHSPNVFNLDWSFKVRRYNAAVGSYRFCSYWNRRY